MDKSDRMTRRHFVRLARRTMTAVGAGSILSSGGRLAGAATERDLPPVAVFSKVYQELKLDFEQSAKVTSAAGLDGIDCPVRPGGEILPEHAANRMPRYAEVLAKRGVKILLLTTGIQGAGSPHVRDILGAAKKLGIRYYRLGFWMHQPGAPAERLRIQIRSSLKELAAMNREMGLCALFQNHSSGNDSSSVYAGGDLAEMYEIVKDFKADEIAVAFDLGHALITHGDKWQLHFQRLRDHIRVVYVKDVRRPSQFVPFGQGEFRQTDFFPLLAKQNYRAPLSMHIEYDWASPGNKTVATLVETLKRNRNVLNRWWKGEPT